MYNLQIETEMKELVDYLDKESTPVGPDTYAFLHPEMAYKILSRFIFFQLREREVTSLTASHPLNTSQKEELILAIPSEDIIQTLRSITGKLVSFLADTSILPFDGFFHFRLSEEKQQIKRILHRSFQSLQIDDSRPSDLDSLHSILKNETTKEADVFIVIESNQKIILRSKDKVYLVDSLQNQDVVLSHLIILAPVTVKVYETHGVLTRETVVILKHLFQDKVVFTREPYPEYRHSKE